MDEKRQSERTLEFSIRKTINSNTRASTVGLYALTYFRKIYNLDSL